jgi:RNA polymerase sigma factor (sigma-70 family)
VSEGDRALDPVRRAQSGDIEAFEMLVQQHAAQLYRLAVGIVGVSDAHDITQDTFTAAWRELPKLRNPERFAPWLRRICVNRCRTHLRANRSAPISLEAGDAEQIAGRGDFRDAVHARELVGRAFHDMTADHRSILALHYGLGLSISDAADTMGLRVGTAKSRLNAALRAMRVVLEREPAEGAFVDEKAVSQ